MRTPWLRQPCCAFIRNNDIDPRRIGYLGLGTESSTDNSAGAVIVRGMVDRALDSFGLPRLSRNCEVPEIKHGCLGGIYALKSAVRYLSTDGRDRQAIVVCTDFAEYERGSSGEQTQGAGAVAMLCEPEAKLFELDLANGGNASRLSWPRFSKAPCPALHGQVQGERRMHARFSRFQWKILHLRISGRNALCVRGHGAEAGTNSFAVPVPGRLNLLP